MKIYEYFNLAGYNSYKLEAYCKKAFFPENEDDLINLYNKDNKNRRIIIGNGNNIILSKDYYTEDFIIFNGNFDNVEVHDEGIIAEAGATMQQLSIIAQENALSGFEIFYDIPSSVGGAVVMNAGADGEEIKDLILKVRYLDLVDLKVKEMYRDNIGFEYRNSFFQRNHDKLVLKTWFLLDVGTKDSILNKMEKIKQSRWSKQPRDYPNAGSVFKRPTGYYVGTLIDNLGLKGTLVGGAKISEKHGGFIINTGNASGKDILRLIEIIREKVRQSFNLSLEIEQIII